MLAEFIQTTIAHFPQLLYTFATSSFLAPYHPLVIWLLAWSGHFHL